MKRLSFFYDISLSFDSPVVEHSFALRCMPPSFPGQDIVDATLILSPNVPYDCQQDSFGNQLQVGCIQEPHDHFRYTVRGVARLDQHERIKEPLFSVYRFPSPKTIPSPEMGMFLCSLNLSPNPKLRAWELSHAVYDCMTYQAGVTGVRTTAAEAFQGKTGVCQDFAHVYLALARLAGIPARYVSGLPLGEGQSHAWCEVWLDGVWTGIDPTRDRWTDDGYLRFCVGRDFGDCPIERGVFWGNAHQNQTVFMRVTQQ